MLLRRTTGDIRSQGCVSSHLILEPFLFQDNFSFVDYLFQLSAKSILFFLPILF